MSGSASYAYDDDGNVASIVGTGGSQYFTFDSANRLVCIDTVEGGCAVSRIHYDVDGRRVLDDKPGLTSYRAYIDDGVNVDRSFSSTVHIEVHAFGERIAYKNSTGDFRQAVVVPFDLPLEVLHFLLGVGLLGLLAWLARRGALVLVLERPAQAGLAATLVVTLVVLPVPVNDAKAGGGGSSTYYWELADRLGTGMVMLDETGARVVHRTYSPFGAEHASAGNGGWLPSHYGGHRKDEDSGLVYMQARWMDRQAGAFLSVDPVVASVEDPQSFNAYAYARNNPISYTDPTGMCIMADCGRWIGQVPAGMSLSQVSNGFAAQFSDPGFLADSGAVAGMFVSDFASGSSPPSFSQFIGGIAETVAGAFSSVGGIFKGGDGPFPTDLVSTRTLASGMAEFAFVPEDVLAGSSSGSVLLGLIPFYDAGAALFQGNYGAAAGYAAFDVATIIFPPLRIGKAGRLLKPIGGEITGYTRHGLNQVIGRDGGRGVAGGAILDAVRNPLKVRSGVDDLGRPFTRFDGARSGVVLNRDGKLVSAWGPARR